MIRSVKPFALRVASLFTFFVMVCAAVPAAAQQEQPLNSISYHLTMSRPSSHLFEVSIGVETANGASDSIDFQMPKWSPGRYAVFDFAKNVQEVRAMGGICPPQAMCKRGPDLPVVRVDDQTWRVQTRGIQSLTISYKVFGDDLSGTFSQLDERHANYNGGSIFMYVAGHKQDPVKLTIDPPALEPDGHLLRQLRAAALHNVFDARQRGAQKFLAGKRFDAPQMGVLSGRDQ